MTKKKVVKRVKKPLTVRQVLNVIDGVLIKEDDTARNLWFVLTALRGPDVGSYDLKLQNTIPIRRAAFPKMTEKSDSGEKGAPADFGDITSKYTTPKERYAHFGRHAEYAAEVLKIGGYNV